MSTGRRFEYLENRCLLSAVTVTTSNDETDGDTSSIAALISSSGADGTISLREAILASNNTPGANSITFAPSLAGTPILLTQGELLISNAVTITGLGADNTTLDAQYNSRIFDVTAAAGVVTLDGLTLQSGYVANADGGAIYAASALTVNNSTVSYNFAGGDGGGIFALGEVTIKNSTVDSNNATGGAAGIESVSGAVKVSNSTLAFNNGGGILAEHGSVAVSNSTVVKNFAIGIQAGTLASDGPVTIRSSIVAGDFPDLSYGTPVSATVSNSLIGDNSDSGLAEAPLGSPDANGNFIGGSIHGAIDPMLGSYRGYNGGPTATLMLSPGSPAIDTGANPDNLTTDQRGAPFTRVAGAKTDMGAFELQTSQFTPTMSASATGSVFGQPAVEFEVAGINGPAARVLEDEPVSDTYYAGAAAVGTPLRYPPSQPGVYTDAASFAGSAEYTAASASTTFTIAQAPTSTTVTSTSGTAVFGQNVDIFVDVGGSLGNPGPTGSVTLWDGNTPLATGPIDSGFYLNVLLNGAPSVGTHAIRATYSGDADYSGSTSTVFNQVIDPAGTTTTVTSSTPAPALGQLVAQDVTFTANVAVVYPGAGTPTGSVTFWDGATLMGAGTLDGSNQATFTTAALSVGTHTITAIYEGDTDFMASPASPGLNQVIHRAENVTTVTSSAVQSTASFGQSITLTAHVSVVAPDTGVPTGTVQFQVDGQNLGSPAPLDASDNASLTTSAIPLGSHRITAVYSGNATVDTSTGLLPGTISTVAGNATGQYLLPTPANNTVLLGLNAVAADKSGDLFIADGSQHIRKLDAKTGIVSTFGPTVSLNNSEYYYCALIGLACDATGDLFIADAGDNVVEKVSPTGMVTILAGTLGGPYYGYDSGDGGPAIAATLFAPSGLAFDAAGDLFIVEAGGGRVREINTAGMISTVAGGGNGLDSSGNYIGLGDGGPATSAVLNNPTGVAVDAAGNLFIADSFDNSVRKVDAATGIISTVASSLSLPLGVAVDAAGNLFIADAYDDVISNVSTSGVITTIAGTSGAAGKSGDGGNATAAQLSTPTALTFDTAGDLFIADSGNNVIREINTAGVINSVVGGGTLGTAGNGGPAIQAPLDNPPGPLAVDAAGDLFMAEPNINVVREVRAGIVTTVAGNGTAGYSGDGGPATAAEFNYPTGVAVDAAGDLFVADSSNNVIREVSNPAFLVTLASTTTAVANSNSTSLFGQNVTFTVTVGVVAPGAGTPTGKVKFSDGNTYLGAGTIDSYGQVTLTTSVLSPGTHTITASYSGDADFLGGSTTVTQQVSPLTAANLQQALSTNSAVTVKLSTDGDAHDLVSAVDGLPSYAGNPVTVTLALGAGPFTDLAASPPPGVTLVIYGNGTTTTIVGQSPALTVASGNVIVSGVIFITATDAPTVLVTGGALKLRNDTLQESSGFADAALAVTGGSVDLGTTADPGGNTLDVNGTGELIHNSGLNPISALGDAFEQSGAALTSPYRVEDLIFHALDAGGGGMVTYVANNVYVTQTSGSIQRGVNAVAAGGTVNVEAGTFSRFDDYHVGGKPLSLSFQNGPSLSLAAQADTSTVLRVTGSPGFNHIEIEAGNAPGSMDVEITHLPTGTFAPTGRIVVHGGGDNAHIEVSEKITLPAMLFADGTDAHLQGGGGTTIEVGGGGLNTELHGGKGRNLLIAGRGPAHLEGGHDDDILIGGYTDYDANEAALWAIMGEWTHTYDPTNALDDYQIRVGHLTNGGGLNTVGGVPVVLNLSTVHDNGAKDHLNADGGRDLFFAALGGQTRDDLDGAGVHDVVENLAG